ncbi:hypothetical protein HUJ04_003629 [Dendroctonus ponderosae]|nr:hypothetical protein HUJ04_003629 [Dendroctonus ponderosae]
MEFCANPTYTKVFWIAKNQKVYRPGDADNTIIAYRITVEGYLKMFKIEKCEIYRRQKRRPESPILNAAVIKVAQKSTWV